MVRRWRSLARMRSADGPGNGCFWGRPDLGAAARTAGDEIVRIDGLYVFVRRNKDHTVSRFLVPSSWTATMATIEPDRLGWGTVGHMPVGWGVCGKGSMRILSRRCPTALRVFKWRTRKMKTIGCGRCVTESSKRTIACCPMRSQIAVACALGHHLSR